MTFDWSPILVTLELAAITTALLVCIGLPIAYGLSRWRSRAKAVAQTVVSLPLVLPPTVLGFYLLVAWTPASFLGRFLLDTLHLQLVFSFAGLVIASVIYSLPFMVNPIQASFEGLPESLAEASLTLGKSRLTTLFRILLPNIRPGLITGVVMGFAHTVGEFGVVLMIGGSIPGSTRTASIAIYEQVETLSFQGAGRYALLLLAISFLILFMVQLVHRRAGDALKRP